MLSQIMSLSPRRLFAVGLVLAGIALGILLIILWQVGLFDSAPPPATIQSAVESVRQEQQEQVQDSDDSAQVQAQQQGEEPAEQQAQAEAAQTQQEQGDSAADPGSDEEQQAQATEEQEAASTDDAQDQPEQEQGSEQQQSSEESEPQQAQEQSQQSEQVGEQAEQEVMTAETPELADLAGTWVLSEQGTSFVGYRIGEEIADIGTTTAVGRTGEIEVTLEFDGVAIGSVTIVGDLRTLRSDQSFRDGALRTRGIESDTYPFATFVLTEPIPIEALPIDEETLSVTVQGTLDLHGVTNAVSIALEGQYVDGLVVIVGSTEIALADYNIEKPTTARVFSIDDVGIMEFQLVLELAP